MRASRGQRGQTAAEYLGVLFFVLALILVFASTDFPGRFEHAVGRQICLTINRAKDCDAPATPQRKLLSEAPQPSGGVPVAPPTGEGGRGDVGEARSGEAPVAQIRYLPDGAGWMRTLGTDGLGRSKGVDFVVNKDALRVPRANRASTPKGFARVQAWAKQHGLVMNRTHLMPNELGALDDKANIVIAPERFNKSTIRAWENKFKQLIRDGDTIHVTEKPIYVGHELVPRSVQIDIWRQTANGEKYVTGACVNVWPKGPPPGVPTG